MKPGGWLHTAVMEIGIMAIAKNIPETAKKIVMPLRISTWLQELEFDWKELKALFRSSRRLDRQDMVMFPIIQALNPKAKDVVHHYWLFNINIRDKQFRILDSWRTIEDKVLKKCYQAIIASIRIH
uniref:Uncharacterized protein n=1 Tax=Avena sativa TaxID=4498 RepID=A0ACD5WWL9_AVESA